MDLPPEELVDKFGKLIANPIERQRFLEALRTNKPKHWSPTSNAPYYRQKIALQMKAVLDELMKTRGEYMWFYKDYPEFKKPRTLYAKINQGIKFLLDKLDEDGMYQTFWSCCMLDTIHNVGVKVSVRQDLMDESDTSFMPTALTSQSPLDWKSKMEDWINSDSSDVFHMKGLYLSDEEIEDIKIRFAGVENIACKVSAKEIKLIRI